MHSICHKVQVIPFLMLIVTWYTISVLTILPQKHVKGRGASSVGVLDLEGPYCGVSIV